MRELVLDFSDCKYWYDIYEVFKQGFKLPDYFGRNLDALWDCLDLFTRDNMKIYLKAFYDVPDELKDCMDDIWQVLCDVHESTPNMSFEIIS